MRHQARGRELLAVRSDSEEHTLLVVNLLEENSLFGSKIVLLLIVTPFLQK